QARAVFSVALSKHSWASAILSMSFFPQAESTTKVIRMASVFMPVPPKSPSISYRHFDLQDKATKGGDGAVDGELDLLRDKTRLKLTRQEADSETDEIRALEAKDSPGILHDEYRPRRFPGSCPEQRGAKLLSWSPRAGDGRSGRGRRQRRDLL